jgi:hypothetical protein
LGRRHFTIHIKVEMSEEEEQKEDEEKGEKSE